MAKFMSTISRGTRASGIIGSNVGRMAGLGTIRKLTDGTNDHKLTGGMPVTIQIVGGKFGEENTVVVAKAVEEALKSFPG